MKLFRSKQLFFSGEVIKKQTNHWNEEVIQKQTDILNDEVIQKQKNLMKWWSHSEAKKNKTKKLVKWWSYSEAKNKKKPCEIMEVIQKQTNFSLKIILGFIL